MKLHPALPVAATLLLSACTANAPIAHIPVSPSSSPVAGPAEVVHTSRYTLVSLTADETLRFPLRQPVSHTLSPPKKNRTLTRVDALRIWLSGTGYGLCLPVTDDIRRLYTSPLPDIWRSAGPLRIHDALQALAGPEWAVVTDELTYTVCFRRTSQTLS